MPGDPLDVLLRVRRLAVDQARQALAECLTLETAASARCEEIAAAIVEETTAATALTSDDQTVEAFADWLRQTLPLQSAANLALTNAEARTKEARTVLAAARAGVRAVEAILEQKEADRRVRQARGEQHALDEIAAGTALR
jgi:flagellar export protein FliJ